MIVPSALETEEEVSSTVEEGKIIGTRPEIGRVVKENTEITLIVSTGEVTYLVEDLIGKNYREVKTELEIKYSLKVLIEEKEVEEKEDKKYDDEEIVAQSVEKGKTLRTGDEIILYIPKVLEKYPDFVNENWSITDIQNWAKEKEINLVIVEKETNEYKEGAIISQNRAKDSVVTKGAELKITIAKKIEEQVNDDNPVVPSEEGETE